MNYIYQLRDGLIQDVGSFNAGFLSAVTLFLCLVVLWLFLHLISRKRVREVIIPGNHGALVVSAGAVADMVRAVVSKQFDCITIKKIILWRGRRGTVMEIHGTYDVDGGRLPEVANGMREAILNNLDGQLGIQSIKEVIPNIKKITAENLRPVKFK
jgi:hypothetical protein